jgi:hypothetical protein
MPAGRAEGWRIRAGTHAASDLTSTYNVVDFALQSDQSHATPWTIDSAGTTPPKHKRVVQNADESWSPDGTVEWAWRMGYMTNGMLSYWLATLLPAGVYSATVTAMTYDATDNAVFYQALIKRPDFPGPDAQYAIGGWGNVIWRFAGGVQIFP